ncbi:MAG: class IV adenylate cyclase [Nanoarchaeota archaeon]|nr:class IV adenylate cyclase [Nanoarchaeota archaeon]
MLLEVETKIKLNDSDVQKFKRKIREIATFEKKGKKVDDYFAIQKDPMYYPKKAFRTRTTSDHIEINFKKHLKKYWTKNVVVKQEFEFKILKENFKDMIELFYDMGFTEWVQKVKYNETYRWKKDKKTSIEINKVKYLGYFIEIEHLAHPSEMKEVINKIEEIIKELGIKPEQIDNTGYTKMLWYKGTKNKRKFVK